MPSRVTIRTLVGLAGERQRVDHLGQRRRVDDHVVGELARLLDHPLGGGEREQLGDPPALVVGEQQPEVRRRRPVPGPGRRSKVEAFSSRTLTMPPLSAPHAEGAADGGRRRSASIRITRLPASASEAPG